MDVDPPSPTRSTTEPPVDRVNSPSGFLPPFPSQGSALDGLDEMLEAVTFHNDLYPDIDTASRQVSPSPADDNQTSPPNPSTPPVNPEPSPVSPTKDQEPPAELDLVAAPAPGAGDSTAPEDRAPLLNDDLQTSSLGSPKEKDVVPPANEEEQQEV
jgi:hypothetical protein